ncbi:MAG: DNA alkylation repair protein [Balneolaceae bacterium]|jgi:3-methyladenine DNA glycosylase AlkD
MDSSDVEKGLNKLANPEIAEHSKRFFKTGPGEYGEGDSFLGIRVPDTRKVAKKFNDLPLEETERLLQSQYHEVRLCALIILVEKFRTSETKNKERIFQLYLDNTRFINNWDLVDISAEHIIGSFLANKNRKLLYRLAESQDLWERRIAIMSTFHFVKKQEFEDTIKIAKRLLHDEHDLIHKAVGWMLREVGKRNQETEQKFLDKWAREMPRTMLRYAIEKFPEEKRNYYLSL